MPDTTGHPALHLGAFLPTMTAPGETLPDIAASARHAEAVGLESVWAVDQLVAGTGAPFVDSIVSLAAAAATTERIGLGFGVMIVPLRPPVWLAKQVASLQQVAQGRVLLGVGAGGDRHDRSWAAVGVPRRERGRRTDEVLDALPALVGGHPVDLGERLGLGVPRITTGRDATGTSEDADATVQLAPGEAMPPLLVGGMSDAALRRAIDHDAGWFLLPLPPDDVAAAVERAQAAATDRGRPTPAITTGMLIALDGDPGLPSDATIEARLTDPDGMFGMPVEAARQMLVRGGVEAAADRLVALRRAGADRVVASIAAGDWSNQVSLFAEAGRIAADRVDR